MFSSSVTEGGYVNADFQWGHARSGWRRFLPVLVLCAGGALVSACGSSDEGQGAVVEDFTGLIAGDEPRAVTLGENILNRGGSAVDAAVAMYFAMSVTLPSRVGLGGGGVCVSFISGDREKDVEPKGEVLEFLPGYRDEGAMVPLGPRGLGALHARRGLMRWQELVSPAETMASFGHPVSRALAQDLEKGRAVIAGDPLLRRALSNQAGNIAKEGDTITQTALGSVLSGIRQNGMNYFYRPPFAGRLVQAYQAAGLPLTTDLLTESFPVIDDGVRVRVGSYLAYLPTPPADGGMLTAQLWQLLYEIEELEDAPADERAHLFAEASAKAFALRTQWLAGLKVAEGQGEEDDEEDVNPYMALVDEDFLEEVFAYYNPDGHLASSELSPQPVESTANPYGAGFVVADFWGDAIACSFTMNGLFGRGQTAGGTGILLPAAPQPGSTGMTPVIVGNKNTGDMKFVGVASGGPAGPVALASVMLQTLDEDIPLMTAMREPRLAHLGQPDVTWVETTLSQEDAAALEARGHNLSKVDALARLNAIFCPDGLLDDDPTCQVDSDPRGFGMGLRIH